MHELEAKLRAAAMGTAFSPADDMAAWAVAKIDELRHAMKQHHTVFVAAQELIDPDDGPKHERVYDQMRVLLAPCDYLCDALDIEEDTCPTTHDEAMSAQADEIHRLRLTLRESKSKTRQIFRSGWSCGFSAATSGCPQEQIDSDTENYVADIPED